MSDDQTRRQMQEALDTTLEPEAYRKLVQDVEQDAETAQDYDKLKRVDGMLREASPAPRPLPRDFAKGVLAKVAQPEALPVPQPLKSGLALAVGLGAGAAIAFGLLVALSAGLLALFGSGSTLGGVALGIVGGGMALYAAVSELLGAAGVLVSRYPVIFVAVLLIPMAWFGLHRLRPLAESEADHDPAD